MDLTNDALKTPNYKKKYILILLYVASKTFYYLPASFGVAVDILFDEILTSNYLQIAFIFGVQTL